MWERDCKAHSSSLARVFFLSRARRVKIPQALVEYPPGRMRPILNAMLRLIALLIGLSVTPAHAGILIEPYAGYSVGSLKMNEDDGNVDGLAYGGRLALNFGRLMLGADYQGIRAKAKFKGEGESPNWNATTLYGFAGLQFYSGFRLTAAVSVTPHESVMDTMPDETTFKGSAYKFGVGYLYSQPIAINVEYSVYKLDEYKIGALEGKTKDAFDTLKYSSIILSLSFPFHFGGR